ncbi:hypothetical protein, partial [Halomonas colorata]|uniref:hypothetical protein n=1 Tax=Halomonas colorata TaxID=2742615 RepID=UPI001D00E554
HGSTESYAVDDSRIIADGSDFFRASLSDIRYLYVIRKMTAFRHVLFRKIEWRKLLQNRT